MAERRGPIAFGIVVLVALLVLRGAPYLGHKREVVAAVPTPNAVTAVSPIPLAPHAQVCTKFVTYSPQSQVARFNLAGGPDQKGSPLVVNADGPGYHAEARVPPGYAPTGAAEVALRPPGHPLIGQFCVRNAGMTAVVLAGTQEGRTVGRSVTYLDAQQFPSQLSLTLREAKPAALGTRAGALLRHDTALNPLTPALAWLLAALVLLLVPLLAFRALAAGFAADDAPAPRDGP